MHWSPTFVFTIPLVPASVAATAVSFCLRNWSALERAWPMHVSDLVTCTERKTIMKKNPPSSACETCYCRRHESSAVPRSCSSLLVVWQRRPDCAVEARSSPVLAIQSPFKARSGDSLKPAGVVMSCLFFWNYWSWLFLFSTPLIIFLKVMLNLQVSTPAFLSFVSCFHLLPASHFFAQLPLIS